MTTRNLPALDDLAKRVREEHHACRDAAQSAVENELTEKWRAYPTRRRE